MRCDSEKGGQMDSLNASVSCSGYQTFGCGSSYSGDDSDDEGSVDLRKPFKSKLNTLQEEGPSNSDEIDQVTQTIPACDRQLTFLPSLHSLGCKDDEDSQAEVSLSLSYSESQCKLTVYIINCRNLGFANAKKSTSNP